MTIRATEVAREGGKETYATLSVFSHKNSEHLTALNLLTPLRLRCEVALYLRGRKARERVWLIVKWPGEERGKLYVGYILCKLMQRVDC